MKINYVHLFNKTDKSQEDLFMLYSLYKKGHTKSIKIVARKILNCIEKFLEENNLNINDIIIFTPPLHQELCT